MPEKGENELQTASTGQGKILVMDDEMVVRKILGEALARFGYEVEVTCDGAEAIERYSQARESDTPFDAVIMDLMVPGGMGGKETIIRLLDIDPEVKAVISSGYTSDPIMTDYCKYGFSAVVEKPYNINEILSTLNSLLAESGQG